MNLETGAVIFIGSKFLYDLGDDNMENKIDLSNGWNDAFDNIFKPAVQPVLVLPYGKIIDVDLKFERLDFNSPDGRVKPSVDLVGTFWICEYRKRLFLLTAGHVWEDAKFKMYTYHYKNEQRKELFAIDIKHYRNNRDIDFAFLELSSINPSFLNSNKLGPPLLLSADPIDVDYQNLFLIGYPIEYLQEFSQSEIAKQNGLVGKVKISNFPFQAIYPPYDFDVPELNMENYYFGKYSKDKHSFVDSDLPNEEQKVDFPMLNGVSGGPALFQSSEMKEEYIIAGMNIQFKNGEYVAVLKNEVIVSELDKYIEDHPIII